MDGRMDEWLADWTGISCLLQSPKLLYLFLFSWLKSHLKNLWASSPIVYRARVLADSRPRAVAVSCCSLWQTSWMAHIASVLNYLSLSLDFHLCWPRVWGFSLALFLTALLQTDIGPLLPLLSWFSVRSLLLNIFQKFLKVFHLAAASFLAFHTALEWFHLNLRKGCVCTAH